MVTNSLTGALAAKASNKSCARGSWFEIYNWRMPEEINRVATDAVSDLLFAPTMGAFEQLIMMVVKTHRSFFQVM